MDGTSSQLLDERAAAKLLSCSVAYLRKERLMKRGIPTVKLGRRLIRYNLLEIETYIKQQSASQQKRRG